MSQVQSTSSPAEEPAGTESFRFGLRGLFLAIAAIATLCGGIQARGAAGFFLALGAISFVVSIWSVLKGKRAIRPWATTVMTISLALAFLLPAVESARETGRCVRCENQLKMLGLGLHNYHDVNKSLPPVCTVDASEAPLQSWRLLLLPFAGSTGFGPFQRFVLNEPWDSPANKRYAKALPGLANSYYRCDYAASPSPNTDYVAVIGADTVWRAGQGVSFNEIIDDPHDTILLIEMKNSGIAWNEPRDLDSTTLPVADKFPDFLKSLSNHRRGLNVLFCDGHVETIPFTIPLDQFQALLTKSGGEIIDRSRW